MAFDLSALTTYTDELSLELISKAVLTTDLLNEIDLRTGLQSGTTAINLMDGDFNVADLSCGWNPSGNVDFSQVDIVIRDKQVKMELCPADLRNYWLSQRMSAGTANDSVPFEEVIADYYVKRLKNYNEYYLAQGDGTGTGFYQQVTVANGATGSAAPAAWTPSNAITQALNIFDAIDESVKDRDDLIMVVSPAYYQTLRRALVAQNYFHYDQGDGTSIELIGTNCKVVKSRGLVGTDRVIAGPAAFMVAGTGLTDDFDTMKFYYDEGEDVVKFRAAWRIGIGVHQVNVFGTNDLA